MYWFADEGHVDASNQVIHSVATSLDHVMYGIYNTLDHVMYGIYNTELYKVVKCYYLKTAAKK